jgi:hypothetical protein
MDTPDLDQLLHRLRTDAAGAPSTLTSDVISRLGPATAQVRTILFAGLCGCLAGVFLSAAITLKVARDSVTAAPPQLPLFSEGIGPFVSL